MCSRVDSGGRKKVDRVWGGFTVNCALVLGWLGLAAFGGVQVLWQLDLG